jgi:hypothetical protein
MTVTPGKPKQAGPLIKGSLDTSDNVPAINKEGLKRRILHDPDFEPSNRVGRRLAAKLRRNAKC